MRGFIRITGGLVSLAMVTQRTACGALFYPECRGQIRGKIDRAIAMMDAIGLLCFILSGLFQQRGNAQQLASLGRQPAA